MSNTTPKPTLTQKDFPLIHLVGYFHRVRTINLKEFMKASEIVKVMCN